MKIEEGKLLLNNFKFACNESGDPYFVVHFSRQEDKYLGDHNGLDKFDACIIIKQLAKDFGIDELLLHSLLMNKQLTN